MRSNDLKVGVVLLFALLMASCATVTPTGRQALPPAEWLADCQEPPATVETNGALAQYARKLRDALRLCNQDKASLREWAEEVGK